MSVTVDDGFPVGFTGTRQGMTDRQHETAKQLLIAISVDHGGNVVFNHGDCVGADAEAARVARALGWYLAVHPPENPNHRAFLEGHVVCAPAPYHVRNRHIVDQSSIIVAAPASMVVKSGGTWYTIRYARSVGCPVLVVWPNGTLTEDGKVGEHEPR